MVILSQKAVSANKNDYCKYDDLARVAAAVELIHLASLVHDDVLDGASLRRNKPTLNATMGNDVSIAFGDYIYSKAFELIGKGRNPDVFECVYSHNV